MAGMNNHAQFGDDFAFSDIRAAVVMDDGSIVRTLNGVPMTAGTSLFLRTPLEQAAPMLLDALKLAVQQNSHDMLMTGEELRICTAAIAAATGENA
jgi:hypothetical protein